MDNNENLESEFYSEIQEKNVTINDLKNYGVPDSLIKEEILLSKIYGDKILLNDETGEIDVARKTVTKIDLNEIEKMDEAKAFIEKLSNNDTNTNIEFLLAKLSKEEE